MGAYGDLDVDSLETVAVRVVGVGELVVDGAEVVLALLGLNLAPRNADSPAWGPQSEMSSK